MVLSVLLQLVWMVVTVVVAVGVLYVLLIDRMVDTEHAPCVNLKHYGQSRRPHPPPLITHRVSRQGGAIGRVCLSVRFHSVY